MEVRGLSFDCQLRSFRRTVTRAFHKCLEWRLGTTTPHTRMLSLILRRKPAEVLLGAGLMIAVIGFADWRIEGNVPLGFLYLFPMLLAGHVMTRSQIALTAGLCTLLTEMFDTFDWLSVAAIPRNVLIFAAFFCMGLFVFEVARTRRISLQHLLHIEREIEARREAEEQLKVLVESSSAAVISVDEQSRILLANEAAHRLFGVPQGQLPGRPVRQYLPALLSVPPPGASGPSFRTSMQCQGRRNDGEAFMADVWFSTYRTGAGSRLAAMVIDTSEDLRNHEELSLNQLLAGSRILVDAVSMKFVMCAAPSPWLTPTLRATARSLRTRTSMRWETLLLRSKG